MVNSRFFPATRSFAGNSAWLGVGSFERRYDLFIVITATFSAVGSGQTKVAKQPVAGSQLISQPEAQGEEAGIYQPLHLNLNLLLPSKHLWESE